MPSLAVSDLSMPVEEAELSEGISVAREESPSSDGTWLSALSWRKSAPRSLVQASVKGDEEAFAHQLSETHAATERRTARLPSPLLQMAALFSPGESDALDLLTREALLSAAEHLRRSKLANPLAALLDAAESSEHRRPRRLAAWLTLLLPGVARLPRELHLRLWRLMLEWCQEVFDTEELQDGPPDGGGAEQLLLLEGAHRAGIVFASLECGPLWRHWGRDGFRHQLEQSIDIDGMPHAELLPELPAWLGSLTRALTDAAAVRRRLLSSEQEDRLLKLARRAAALCAPDGTLPGVDADSGVTVEMLQTFCRLAGWKPRSEPRRYLHRVEKRLASRSSAKSVACAKPPRFSKHASPAWQSDDSRVALLRGDWTGTSDLCVVDHAERTLNLRLFAGGAPLIVGEWGLTIRQGWNTLAPESAWDCDCWHSDRDGDFAEFGIRCGEVIVSRQVFLSRRERFLLLAESLRGPDDAELSIESRLPLVGVRDCESDGFSRESQLVRKGGRVRLFPISHPWERVQAASGQFEGTADELRFTTRGRGRLCQALVLDWSPDRTRDAADWSAGTVVEEGRAVSSSQALARRWRVGRRQWMLLENLTRCGVPRTAFGCHTGNETVIGEFDRHGRIHPLVHVEAGGGQPETDEESSADS